MAGHTRFAVPALLLAFVTSATSVDAAPLSCRGRYLVLPSGEAFSSLQTDTVVTVAPADIAVGGCAVSRLRVSDTDSGTTVHGLLRECRLFPRRRRVVIAFDAECATLTARVFPRRRGRVSTFRASRSECGDGRVDRVGGEPCDGSGASCGPGAVCDACRCGPGPTLPPPPPALCGDGRIEDPERCDGTNLGGTTCQDYGYRGGDLRCFQPGDPYACSFDFSACPQCGDGVREGPEVCDGDDLPETTCVDQGYAGGVLGCTDTCYLDPTECFYCGDAQVDEGETCDRENLAATSCESLGYSGGQLACTLDCKGLDRSGCTICGDHRIDRGEECDDGNATDGDGCDSDCRSECGDGIVEGNELCDDGNRRSLDGCSAFCVVEKLFGGGGPRNDCRLEWGIAGGVAEPRQSCRDGDPRCDADAVSGSCTFVGYACLNDPPIVFGTGAPSCTATNIRRIELLNGSLGGPGALDQPDRARLLEALGTTLARGGATVTIGDTAVEAAPPVTRRYLCGRFEQRVPVDRARTLAVRALDASGNADTDVVELRCLAP